MRSQSNVSFSLPGEEFKQSLKVVEMTGTSVSFPKFPLHKEKDVFPIFWFNKFASFSGPSTSELCFHISSSVQTRLCVWHVVVQSSCISPINHPKNLETNIYCSEIILISENLQHQFRYVIRSMAFNSPFLFVGAVFVGRGVESAKMIFLNRNQIDS